MSMLLLEVVIKIRCANTGLQSIGGLSLIARGVRVNLRDLDSGGSISACIICESFAKIPRCLVPQCF